MTAQSVLIEFKFIVSIFSIKVDTSNFFSIGSEIIISSLLLDLTANFELIWCMPTEGGIPS